MMFTPLCLINALNYTEQNGLFFSSQSLLKNSSYDLKVVISKALLNTLFFGKVLSHFSSNHDHKFTFAVKLQGSKLMLTLKRQNMRTEAILSSCDLHE